MMNRIMLCHINALILLKDFCRFHKNSLRESKQLDNGDRVNLIDVHSFASSAHFARNPSF